MANQLINGPYGWYYKYIDVDGTKRNLSIKNDIYNNYVSKGYMTIDHIESMTQGKTISFTVPRKSGSGEYTVTAKLIPYTRVDGGTTKIIEITLDQSKDDVIIKSKSKELLNVFYKDQKFDYHRVQDYISQLDLEYTWKTFAEYQKLDTTSIAAINCYIANSSKSNKFSIYGMVENSDLVEIDEAKYKSLKADYESKRQKAQEEADHIYEEIYKVRAELKAWLKDIEEKIFKGNKTISGAEFISNVEAITNNINTPNLEDRVRGLVNSRSAQSINYSSYYEKVEKEIYSINSNNYNDSAFIEDIKNKYLNNLKTLAYYKKLRSVRDNIYKEYKNNGIESLTDNIDIDTALSLGYFTQVKKALTKYKKDAPRYIIYEMHKDIIDTDELKEHILNMLKIFYDFYDMPEKDRKAIAKFVAQNRLKDYYDTVSQFDDVLEILIDNSRDPKLTKPLLEGIAGTAKANVLKDKTYYFEKRGRLRGNIILYKPIELLDELRNCIKEFNISSSVAILTNIELDVDESFIFQFYTFADSEGDEKGFDGRRMLNLTRIFNRGKDKDHKIGFLFDNEYEEDIEDTANE